MAADVVDRPVIGVTMGDAAGIGPEIVLKALWYGDLRAACRCVVIGDAAFLRSLALHRGAYNAKFEEFGHDEPEPNTIEVFDLDNLRSGVAFGIDQAGSGKASAEYIEAAVALWREKRIDAISTAPISKRAIHLGGYDFPGHTEFLASLTDTKNFAMSFFGGDLRVVLLSTHLALRDAIDRVKTQSLIDLIEFSASELEKLLGKKVRLAVAGLNPHASEGGMFGSEERDEIIPAVNHCRNILNIDVSGPYSPDTIFLRGHKGEFDGVIALYHDQATIAVKSLAFGSAVNVTLGLPLIRTSVDHGTAYDIAGQWRADHSSMVAAIRLAGELVSSSRKTVQV
jgi:4-hydroxythreonine-4-phosphate dehydrogenase